MEISLFYFILPVLTKAFLWNWLGCASCGGYGDNSYAAYPPVFYDSLPEYYTPTYRVVSLQSPPTVIYRQRQPLVYSEYNGYNRAPFSYSTVRTAQLQPSLPAYSLDRNVVRYSYLPSYSTQQVENVYVPTAHKLADTYGRKMKDPHNSEKQKTQQIRREEERGKEKEWKSEINFHTEEMNQWHSGTSTTTIPIVRFKETTGSRDDEKLLKNKIHRNGPEIVKLAIPPNLPPAHPDVKEDLESERSIKISPKEIPIAEQSLETSDKEKKTGSTEENEFIPIGKDIKLSNKINTGK